LYRLLTGENPQTLHPRRLADAPALFELLCDCVEVDPDRRVDVGELIGRLKDLSPISQPQPEPIKPSPKPVEKPIQPEQSRIVNIDKRKWWNQLDEDWKEIFKKAANINVGFFKGIFGFNNDDLEKIVNLQKLDFSGDWNKKGEISDLEPLRALTNLQELKCHLNQISDLEPLRALTNLQVLVCYSNQISDLEPLRTLTNLQGLDCHLNQISDSEKNKFKKAVPNCEVIERRMRPMHH